MNEKIFDINKLRVASPCPSNWEDMRGDKRVRFCDLCSLNVYNVSEMTTAQVQNLITKSEGRICARIYKRADGTIITNDCPIGLRAYYKRTARFAGAALTAILGLFSISFGQSDKKDKKTVSASEVKIERTINQNQESILSGTVLDPMGAVIPNAELTLYRKDSKTKLIVRPNNAGDYAFSLLSPGIYILETKSPGFKTLKITSLEIKNNEKSKLDITLEPSGEIMVGVIVDEDPLIDTSSGSVTHRITRKMIERLPF
jgi:hypothetical protein